MFDEAMRGLAGNAFTVVESLFVRALNDAHDQIVAAVNSTIVLPAA